VLHGALWQSRQGRDAPEPSLQRLILSPTVRRTLTSHRPNVGYH
jgi:hypothetical protein